MKNDHLVINTKTQAFECLHCGATEDLPIFPIPLAHLCEIERRWRQKHGGCKPQQTLRDTIAMNQIADLLSESEWDSSTIEDVADIVRNSGRIVSD